MPQRSAIPTPTVHEPEQELKLPAITHIALDRANPIAEKLQLRSKDQDEDKTGWFIHNKGITRHPPAPAIGGKYQAVAGMDGLESMKANRNLTLSDAVLAARRKRRDVS